MKNKVIRFGYLILLSFTLVLLCLCFTQVYIAYAAEIDTSSTIMYELTSDPSFNKDDYPANATDYSLKVIQIGESKERDLFLYVHQPARSSTKLEGTSVSISYGFSRDGKDLHPKMYSLELVSTSGMFDKYLVKGIKDNTTSGTDGRRYYNIVAIYREFKPAIDTSIEIGHTSEIGIEVRYQCHLYHCNGTLTYDISCVKTMQINIKAGGSVTFSNGFKIGNLVGMHDEGHAWIAAFDVPDYIVQHIYDADISFQVKRFTTIIQGGYFPTVQIIESEWEDKAITLTDTQEIKHKGDGLLARTYQWDRIMSAEEFIKTAEEQKVGFNVSRDTIKNSQWVFSFYETESSKTFTPNYQSSSHSEVEGFTILRLHFLDTSGKVYDLGVVADKITPDAILGYGGIKDLEDIMKDIGDVLGTLIMIIGIILLVIVLVTVSGLITLVVKAIKFIFKGIMAVITFPLKFIAGLFKNEKR